MQNTSAFFMENKALLEAFAAMSGVIGARPDYVQGGGGNTSVKLPGGQMAIKASGYMLGDIRPDAAYAVLDGAAIRSYFETTGPQGLPDVEGAGAAFVKAHTLAVPGLPALRPSVEAGFHSLLDTFVIHSHSVYANLAACSADGQAALAEAFKGAPYGWAYIPYTDPGARLTYAVLSALGQAEGGRPKVLVLQNHGVAVHDQTAEGALGLHQDANRRIAEAYGVREGAYPAIALRQGAGGLWESGTAYLKEALRGYSPKALLEAPIYPDQMVYLQGTLELDEAQAGPGQGKCRLAEGGGLLYNMPEAKARVVEETLTAVLFVMEHIKAAGHTVSTMAGAAKAFIAGWESEAYRKTLAGK